MSHVIRPVRNLLQQYIANNLLPLHDRSTQLVLFLHPICCHAEQLHHRLHLSSRIRSSCSPFALLQKKFPGLCYISTGKILTHVCLDFTPGILSNFQNSTVSFTVNSCLAWFKVRSTTPEDVAVMYELAILSYTFLVVAYLPY